MEFGIAQLSVIPGRSKAEDSSEQVTQLLFGETYRVLEKKENWVKIIADLDGYEFWIGSKQHSEVDKALYEKISQGSKSYSINLLHSAISNTDHIPLVLSSTLPNFDGMNFKLGKRKFVFSGQAYSPSQNIDPRTLSIKIALKYLNSPYAWGGRSPLGIDCSGLSQNVYKIIGLNLKRDAYQQVDQGKTVDFIDSANNGDLAFFHNDENRINHVGIVYDRDKGYKEIIHASGKVRIDRLDNHGIFNEEQKKYTHNLRIVKSLL